MADHESVRAGIVEPRRDANGDVRLIAHVVARAGSQISASELRDFLKIRLPVHAIPSAFLFLDQVPLNAHGKLDRSALLAPAQPETAGTEAAVPARRFTEKVLSDIWIDLLKVESISVTDNFFDLGGHSLLAGQAMARVARALGVSLPIKTIFEAPTIEELARRVDEAVVAKPRQPPTSVPRLADSGPRTLSIAQDQMMRIEQNLPDLPLFNLPFAFHLEGPIDPRMLAQAIDDIVRRHESLRTAFGWNGEEPVSRIIAPAALGPVLTVETIGDGRPHNNKRRKALELRKIELLIAQETYTPVRRRPGAAAAGAAAAAARRGSHPAADAASCHRRWLVDRRAVRGIVQPLRRAGRASVGAPAEDAAGVLRRRALAALVVRHRGGSPPGRRLDRDFARLSAPV